jgi:pectinesterase
MKTLLLPLLLLTMLTAAAQKQITVAKDGSGDFTTVQAAINAVPSPNLIPVTIYIKAGEYREVVKVDSAKNFITLKGESAEKTIISFGNHTGSVLYNGDTLNTWTCATFFVFSNDFNAENIHFRNNAGFTAGQAVAVRVHGTRVAFRKCMFTGFQDVLFLSGDGVKNYFDDCYIEGTTDFIFGAATAVFNNCRIHSKKNSHVTAASTAAANPFGFVFFNCRLTADTGLNKVSLGRPWRPFASVTYINCYIDKHIIAAGWDNWKNTANEATARFAEYNSSGPGARVNERASWSRQLTGKEAKRFTIKNILGNWQPKS